MRELRHVLVALARGPADAGLIRYAAAAARVAGLERVRFVHVLPEGGGHGAPGSAPRDPGTELAEIRAQVARELAGAPAGVETSCHVLHGPLTDTLLKLAEETDVDGIMVGHRLDHPGRPSLARRLAMTAPCYLWMAPEGSPPSLRRVLVPVDFSEASADALRLAVRMARSASHPDCLALHVYFDDATTTYQEREEVLAEQERRSFDRFMERIDTSGVTVTPVFVEAPDVTHAVHRTATERGADLVIVSTRGRSPSASILLGTVAEQLIVETRLPLLVVKRPGKALNLLQVLLERAVTGDRLPHP